MLAIFGLRQELRRPLRVKHDRRVPGCHRKDPGRDSENPLRHAENLWHVTCLDGCMLTTEARGPCVEAAPAKERHPREGGDPEVHSLGSRLRGNDSNAPGLILTQGPEL